MTTVRELLEALEGLDQDSPVHVCLDLSEPDSISFHEIREVHGTCCGGLELVVYEAYDLFDTPPGLAAVLLEKPAASVA